MKLVSSSVGTGDTTLLTNTKTGADAAKGVGVMIEGDANPLSAKMTLVPNKADSIYHFHPMPISLTISKVRWATPCKR